MVTEYKNIEYRLHESLVQIQEMLCLLEFDDELLQCILECKELIKNKKYNVAVMGEFKRGKSSLINALLGSKILPADSTPTTATVNRITYGTTPKTIITYKDDSVQQISIDELSEYVTKITPSGEARATQIKEATVYFPTVICQNHIDIIDTPGLNDDERMTQITIDMLKNVDAVIVPIHAKAPFSDTEKNFVCQLIPSENIDNIVFVVTFIDQLDEDDYEYEPFISSIKARILTNVFDELKKREKGDELINRAHELLDGLNIFGISSALALKSFISNNREMLRQSHFEQFNKALLRIVTAKQLESAVRKTIENIRLVVSQLDFQFKKKIQTLNSEKNKNEKAKNSILKYCNEAYIFLDKTFSYNYNSLIEIANKLNMLKNSMLSEFIKNLSEIKINTNDAIISALLNASTKCYEMANTNQKDEIVDKIFEVYNTDLQKITSHREKEISKHLSFFDAENSCSSENTTKEMYESLKRELDNVLFKWVISPMPEVADLTNFNVIDNVINAVDISVSAYIKEYYSCFSTIRKNWFGIIASEAEKIKTTVLAIANNKSDFLDSKMNVQVMNFKVLSENSKQILLKCEDMWKEFEIKERSHDL